MRNNLPAKPHRNECGIINLDSKDGPGTHWTAYYKKDQIIDYIDPMGNLQPPKEIVSYLGDKIQYNFTPYQQFDSFICGHICLMFLYMKAK
jgi:hypothetical protein